MVVVGVLMRGWLFDVCDSAWYSVVGSLYTRHAGRSRATSGSIISVQCSLLFIYYRFCIICCFSKALTKDSTFYFTIDIPQDMWTL